MMWDFFSLSPESLHQVTILFSDRGTPQGHRHMHGFSSHTFSLHQCGWRTVLGEIPLQDPAGDPNNTSAEAIGWLARTRITRPPICLTPSHGGDYPKWRVCVQIMPEVDAETYHLNPFDLTKVWPHQDYPLIEVGEMELNRNPQNYFAEVEQAAFSPSNIVPGIGFSARQDAAGAGPVLPGRAPLPARRQLRIAAGQPTACDGGHTYHRDGAMRFDDNGVVRRTMSPTALAVRSRIPGFASRRSRSPTMRTKLRSPWE